MYALYIKYHYPLQEIKYFSFPLPQRPMMVDLYKHYSKSILWNTFESFFYQLLLLAHQFALFAVTDRATYGLIGTLFSTTYLLVMVTNFGLDVSMSAFFTQAIESKKHFRKIVLFQLIPEYCLLITIGIIMLFLYPWIPAHSIPFNLGIYELALLGLLIIFEGSKKTLRSLLQLGFHSRKTALVEVATIMSYIAIVWTGYFMGYPINFMLVFLPLLVVSTLSSMILLIFIVHYYRTLPDSSSAPLPNRSLQWRIVRNRFFNFLNQTTHALFSSNFLVPFFAMAFGLTYAGILKLTASIAHCITSIVQKIFGISGTVLLAHLKESSLEDRQKAFFTISHRLNQVLYGFILFFAINHGVIVRARVLPETTTILTLAYLFLIIIFSENFFLAYEKFYITHEKANHLFFFNLIIMGLIGALLTQVHNFSHISLMLAIIGLRLVSFIAIILFSFHQWRIKPALKIQPYYFATSLIGSLLFFVYMR